MRIRRNAIRILTLAFGAATFVAAVHAAPDEPTLDLTVGPVPAAERERLHLAASYTQYCSIHGFPVVASAKANPFALREAAYLIDHMLSARPDVRQAMIANRAQFTVMAVTEMTTDVPEHASLEPKEYWDRRARGLGGTFEAPCTSGGEENLLALKGDPYSTENITIHEFGHAVHEIGLHFVDPTFDERLTKLFDAAKAEGLWKGTYAMSARQEYWAEGTQSWFDCNRANDSSHGDIDTREKLKTYDARLAALLTEVYGDSDWRYVRPTSRPATNHLTGFDRSSAPTFRWPDRPTTSTSRPSR